MKFDREGQIDNNSLLIQVRVCRQTGDKSFPDPMMTSTCTSLVRATIITRVASLSIVALACSHVIGNASGCIDTRTLDSGTWIWHMPYVSWSSVYSNKIYIDLT